MGCNCNKRNIGSQAKQIVKTQPNNTIREQNNTLKRIIKRSSY